MACDRFVELKNVPTLDQLQLVVEDYFGGLLVDSKTTPGCIHVQIQGTFSHPFQRFDPSVTRNVMHLEEPPRERWIEVHLRGHLVNVLTRQQDEVTSAIADGLVRVIDRCWRGTIDKG